MQVFRFQFVVHQIHTVLPIAFLMNFVTKRAINWHLKSLLSDCMQIKFSSFKKALKMPILFSYALQFQNLTSLLTV